METQWGAPENCFVMVQETREVLKHRLLITKTGFELEFPEKIWQKKSMMASSMNSMSLQNSHIKHYIHKFSFPYLPLRSITLGKDELKKAKENCTNNFI